MTSQLAFFARASPSWCHASMGRQWHLALMMGTLLLCVCDRPSAQGRGLGRTYWRRLCWVGASRPISPEVGAVLRCGCGSGVVNPKAIAAMAELGYDLSVHESKSLDDVKGSAPFDAVVTMGCGDACPWMPTKRWVEAEAHTHKESRDWR